MSIDLLLRALRSSEVDACDLRWVGNQIEPLDADQIIRKRRRERLADKLHKKIVERFDTIHRVAEIGLMDDAELCAINRGEMKI